jgi:hypothetical protein
MLALLVVEFIALAVADGARYRQVPKLWGGKQWAARDPGRGSTVGTVEVRGRQQRAVFATLVRHLHLHLLCNWWQKLATSAPKTNDDTQAGHAPGRTGTRQVLDGWARAEAECGAFGIIGPASQWIAGSQLTAHSSQLDMDADMTWAGTRTWHGGARLG